MSTIALDLSDLARLQDLMQAAPEIAQEELMRFGHASINQLTAEAVDRTPSNLGALRQSIIGTVEASTTGILGVVGTPLPYAPAVEHGTKPHPVNEAGIESLTFWAQHKFSVAPKEAGRIAHAVAWKIRRKGTKGAHMFEEALKANEAKIRGDFRATVERIAARIGGAS